MGPFDPFHIKDEPGFDYGWSGDAISPYSPFFYDGVSMISKRHLISHKWVQVLMRPRIGRSFTAWPHDGCDYFERFVAMAKAKYRIVGRDHREGEDCAVLVSPAHKYSCMVPAYRLVTVLASTMATEIYGDLPVSALVFWKDDELR